MANEFKVKNGIIISGSADIEQNLTVRGTLTADQYNVSIVSTSILYESGSTKFGNTLDDLHEFTGSVAITGSITLNGNPIGTGKLDEATFNSFTSSYTTGAFTGSFIGDGSQLTNIPSSGVTGLNLNKIISGSVSASISPDKGLEINTNTIISGALNVSGAITLNGEPIGTGKLDETTFNTFTSSYTTVSGSIDNRLDVLEAYSGSQQVPTASFAFRTQRTDVYCKNVSGTQIDKGTVVRIIGSVGDNPLIGVASLLTEGQSANTLGIAAENIPNDSFGLVITEGVLIGVNTSGMTAGQLIFLGENGTFTTSYPVSPNHGVRLGEVLRVQQNQGSIYVRVDNGAELGESHDVYDTTTNSSYGDLLVKSGSVWVNSRSLNGDYAVTGSLTITQNLTVLGSSSLVYVTSSNLAVSASFISVNVFEPAERFGGLKVYDSGSSNATASLAWDSLHNHWVYQNVSGSSYSGGMLLSGPRNSGSLGDEPNLINGRIVKSVGGDHIDVSIISETGTTITVAGDLVANSITGAFDFLGLVNRPTLVSGSSQIVYSGLTGIPSSIVSGSEQIGAFGFLQTSSFNTYTSSNDGRVSSLESKTGSYATTGSNAFVGNENINGNLSVTGSVVISGSLDISSANVGSSRYLFAQTTGSTTWNISHNLNYNYPNVTVYDGSNNKVMLPADVISIDSNTTQVTFATPEYGYALVSVGGITTASADRFLFTATSATSSWVIDHNLNYKYPNIDVYDSNDEQLIPQKVKAVSNNRVQIDFATPTSGNAIITLGGPRSTSIFNQTGSFYNTQYNIGITGSLVVTGDVDADTFNTTSDKKLKTDLIRIEGALDKIEKLNGYTFNWLEEYSDDRTKQIGMLADEVYEVQPELISKRTMLLGGKEEEIKLLDYAKVNALLVEGIKELTKRVTKLENKNKKK